MVANLIPPDLPGQIFINLNLNGKNSHYETIFLMA